MQREIERVNQMDNLDDKVTYLRSQSEVYTTRARDYENPRTVAKLGVALDRLATIEQLRAREEAASAAQGAVSVDAGEELENPLTATRLRDVRSKLLAQARVLRKYPDPSRGGDSQARQLENLAHAMNEDLLSDETASATYNQARAFTRAARAVTERTF